MIYSNKSFFRYSANVLGLRTTEKSEVSSANGLATDINPSGKSLMIHTNKLVTKNTKKALGNNSFNVSPISRFSIENNSLKPVT